MQGVFPLTNPASDVGSRKVTTRLPALLIQFGIGLIQPGHAIMFRRQDKGMFKLRRLEKDFILSGQKRDIESIDAQDILGVRAFLEELNNIGSLVIGTMGTSGVLAIDDRVEALTPCRLKHPFRQLLIR